MHSLPTRVVQTFYIRLHGDSSASSAVTGASGLYPSKANKYVSKLSSKSKKLSECLLKAYCKETKIRNRGGNKRDDLTGTNWSKIPVSLIEMGFMSNPAEDRKMQKSKFQTKWQKELQMELTHILNKQYMIV